MSYSIIQIIIPMIIYYHKLFIDFLPTYENLYHNSSVTPKVQTT